MTPEPAPPLSAALLSRVAGQLAALAHPDRLTLLAAVVRRGRAGLDCSLSELAADQGCDTRALVRHAVALESAGLVQREGHRLTATLDALGAGADALTSALPVVTLLTEEPDLARFFVQGRLPRLPVLTRVEERQRLAGLVVRLLPEDRSLTEPEVNAMLGEVMDDVAALRRFLVEEGRLTRRGAEDYRRVPAASVPLDAQGQG